MSNAPTMPIQDVMSVLDLATGPDEALQAALMAATARVVQEQGLSIPADRLQAAVKVVRSRSTGMSPVTITVPDSIEAPVWKKRPVTEEERQARLKSLSTGFRGWLRRKSRTDAGAEVPEPKWIMVWAMALPILSWATLFVVPLNLFFLLFPTIVLSTIGILSGAYAAFIWGKRYKRLLPAVVDDALRQRLLADPAVRHQVIHGLTGPVGQLLRGDLEAITKHWDRVAEAVQVEGQPQADLLQEQMRDQLMGSTATSA